MVAFLAQPAEKDVFLALRVLYAVVLCLSLVSWGFFSESLPGDDVLISRLLSHPLHFVCLPCMFVLFCFLRPCLFSVSFGLAPSIL